MKLCLAALALVCASAASAQESGSPADIAQLLTIEDRREFDGATLQRATQHPDPRVRERAAMTLGRIGDPAANALLVRLLLDRDTTVRLEAVFAMGELGDRSVVAELAALAGQFASVERSSFAVELVTALAKIGGPEAEAVLGGILDRHPATGDGADRATATVLLEAHRLPRTSAIASRLADYIRSPNEDWRRNATYSATRLPVWSTAPVLMEIAADADALTRQWAVRGLTAVMADSSGVSRQALTAVLRNAIDDRNAQVRTNALRALATFADSSLVSLASPRLTDREPGVSLEAAVALGRLGGSRALALLRERLPAAQSFAHRRALAVAAARIDPAAALEMVRNWRGDPDWRTRSAYIEVLNASRTPAAAQQLREMLDDADPRIISQALGALGAVEQLPDSALVIRARRLLASPDVHLRAAAIDVLGRTRDMAVARELTAAYRQAQADEENDARLAAVNALADLAQTPGGAAQGDGLFLSMFSRSNDYLVRRLAARRFGEAAYRRTWGSVMPVESGRSAEEYRELARRYVLREAPAGRVTIETERGSIVVQLFGYESPLTVDNFVRLVDRRYFDNGRWHRVVPNFVIQDGDPRGDGSGGPGTVIRDEINRYRYNRGTLGMALSGPDTGGSQFFITHSPQPHLDGGYTVFGEVVAGWDVLDQIVQGDRVRRIYR